MAESFVLPKWSPAIEPLYKIDLTYEQNFETGPFFHGKFFEGREIPPEEEWFDFLGYKVMTPVGISDGILLNSRWVEVGSKLGFDLLTYKAIAFNKRESFPFPNITHVDYASYDRFENTVHIAGGIPIAPDNLALMDSFGLPSKGKDFLLEDIAKAKQVIKKGQVLIVSIASTVSVEELVSAALIAKEAGADIIEVNLQIPIEAISFGPIYYNTTNTLNVLKKVVEAVKDTPVIAQIGHLENILLLKGVLVAIAQSGVRAVSGINSRAIKLINAVDGSAALGEERLEVNICGHMLQELTVRFIQNAVNIKEQLKLDLDIIGTNGVVVQEDFDVLFSCGCIAAMVGLPVIFDPYLGYRYLRNGEEYWKRDLNN